LSLVIYVEYFWEINITEFHNIKEREILCEVYFLRIGNSEKYKKKQEKKGFRYIRIGSEEINKKKVKSFHFNL
jgi:hypothetical protein